MTATHLQRIMLLALALGGAGNAAAATSLWWDTAYVSRFNVAVQTGVNSPDKGYAGYTARTATLDTATLIAAGELLSDCSDLRVLYYNGIGWQELPRHVIGCNTASTDIRFAIAADIAASSTDDNYYIYVNNPAAGAAPAVTPTNVYLWYDDASVDRSAAYVRGRIDPWHGTGWDNSLAWNPAGYYTYDNGDNFTSGYRRAVDERDVFIEAEFFHTGCYPLNQTTGVMVRGIIASGSNGSETSNHYYTSNRGQYPGCNTGGYSHDGDIMRNQRNQIAVNGTNPPALTANVWRRQAVAAWLTVPTNLSFWDEDLSTNWAALGFPSAANLQVSGTDNAGVTGRGFAAVMTAQDRSRLRNVVIRRYVEPEPSLSLSFETQPPLVVVQKTVDAVYDPVNTSTNPRAIPGAWIEYSITTTNSGVGSVDSESLSVTDTIASDADLFVGDITPPGGGPVEFVDGTGAAASGLSFVFGGLDDLTDDVEFSTDGLDWSYEPVADLQGYDSAARYIRVNPTGTFAGASGGTPTEFTLRFRIRVR